MTYIPSGFYGGAPVGAAIDHPVSQWRWRYVQNELSGTSLDITREVDLQINIYQLRKPFKNLGGGLLLMEIPLKAVWTPDKNLSKGSYALRLKEINLHLRTFFAYIQRVV